MIKQKVVIVEDEKLLGKSIKRFLSPQYDCEYFTQAEDAERWLDFNPVDVIVTDISLPKKSGMEFLDWLKEKKILVPVIIMTAYSSVKNAVSAIKIGAFDYITKPLDLEELAFSIRKALDESQPRKIDTPSRLKGKQVDGQYFFGNAESVTGIEKILKRLVEVEINTGEVPTVLITGDTGTGKGIIARRLHQLSPRSKSRFVELNCTAITETMFESELFGHEKGAFTGAEARRIGLFEQADGGTLFLDEMGHAPLSIQAKLLKVIENKTVRRVGGNQELKINVRLVTATNLDLNEAVSKRDFREDLFHRLSLVRIHMPSLKDRPGDIKPLSDFFLQQACEKYKVTEASLSHENYNILEQYSWPGNVRELKNEVERSVLMFDGSMLSFDHLVRADFRLSEERTDSVSLKTVSMLNTSSIEIGLPGFEKRVIEQALLQCGSNISAAAEMLTLTRDVLRYRIQKHKIDMSNLKGWEEVIPENGIDLEKEVNALIERALKNTRGNVTGAAKILNISRDMIRYRINKYQL